MSKMRTVVLTASLVLCALIGVANANEHWTCVKKYDNDTKSISDILIAEDRLIFKGGIGAYTIFENNNDHVLAFLMLKHDNGDTTTSYLLLERSSGRLTVFYDSTIVAIKGIFGTVTPTAGNSECTRN
jgi:hypothetical protein